MFMPSTPVFPQGGSYAIPAAGDIVYFQHDTFPPELGIVTDATLTGGTFKVNDFALMGGQSMAKFKTADKTDLVSASTLLNKGDLVVANTTANPTSDRYSWHIATVDAPVNDAAFRLDGASAAPTFASNSSFSAIHPTATTTDNAATAGGTLAVSVGDLVFAKVFGGNYGWHIVTGAGDLSSVESEGTAVLDGLSNAYASLVASSSQMAKLTPGAEGAATDTSTSFSFGDIMFAKTTANSGTNNTYAFHTVSSGNNGSGGAASTNLRLDNSSSNLTTGATYIMTIGVGVKDRAGNQLAAPSVVSFTTGSTGSTNTTPPFVTSTNPTNGNQNFPTTAPANVQFSVDMAVSGSGSVLTSSNVGIYTDNFGAPGSLVPATNTYNSTTRTVTITPASALTASTGYILKVANTTTSNTLATMQEYRLSFRTSSGVDSVKPRVLGVYPSTGATSVARNLNNIALGFSEDMDPASITSSSVTLSGGISGTVSYSPSSRSANFSPSVSLAANTTYTVTITSAATDLSANPLDQDAGTGGNQNFTSTFTTATVADSAAPSVISANADNFGVAVTFSEAMKSGGGPSAADNIANYTLESPVGSSISLGGKTVSYDGPTMTAKVSGLALQNGNSFKITIGTQTQDLSDNAISTSGTPAGNVAYGTVANSSQTGGQLGPGSGPQQDAGTQGMNPVRVSPTNRSAGATSDYMVEFPVSTSIPVGGNIVLTFPTGFDVTNAVAATAQTQSFRNSDINGPASGTITIASVTANASARTVTIVTAGAATGVSFLSLDLKGITNSTIPSAVGYTVDIKTRDGTSNNTLLENKTSAPFFLGQTGSYTLTVRVFNDNGAGGGTAGNNVKDGTEAGIVGARLFLFSPATGGSSTTTIAGGVATTSNLSSGDYMLGIDPSSVGSFPVNSAPQQITISANTTKNIGLGGSGSVLTIAGSVTGESGTKVDVFATSQSGFTKTTLTLTGGADAYSLPVTASTTYQVGVGPSMPEAFFTPGAPPPPPPTFTFMPPPNLQVQVNSSNVTGKDFVLTTTNKTITGTVLDSSGSAISGAGIFARPVSDSSTGDSSIGFGTGGQSGVDGSFTLRVVPGVYLVGVFKPGMPSVPDKQITVPSSGANTPSSLAFTLGAGTSLTITGSVKDDSGNAIPYAGIGARRVNSTSDSTMIGGGTQNFVTGQSDANGAYTLYVSAGTWIVEAYAPGFGKLGTKTITISSSSSSGQDFSAQNLTLYTISGSATKDSVAQQGVMVRAEGVSGGNMVPTDASGAYSLKVPAGTYTVTCMFPGVGEGTPFTADATSGNDSTDTDCALAAPITLTINVTDGTNAIQNAFVDVRDSNGRGNGTSQSTVSGANAVYTINVPPGTYTVRVGHPAYGQIGSTASVNSTRTITHTASSGQLFAVSGTVSDASATAINGAWVTLIGTPTGQTNLINIGGQTSSSGAYSINVPAGTYRLRADKPGYKSPAETSLTISAASTGNNITLTLASKTITGTVTLSSAGVSGAFVDAVDGAGGFAVAQTDSSGAYSLAVDTGTWTLRAHSMGYEGSLSGVTVAGSNVSGQTITLSAISGFTVRQERQETITPTSGGMVTNADISGFKLNIPANALGTGSNAGTIKTQNNTAIPNPSTGSVLSKNAVTISAVDSSGQPIKNLNEDVTIVVPYSEADIPAGTSEGSLSLGVWNDATQSYDSLSTTVDTSANTLTATVSHFSDFVPLVPSSSGSVTTTSSSNTTTVASSPGGYGPVGGSSFTPNAVKPRAQIVYPDGRVVYLDSVTPVDTTTVTVPPVVPIVASVLKVGSTGAEVVDLQTLLEKAGVLKIPRGVAKGYFGDLTKNALKAYQKKNKLAVTGEANNETRQKIGLGFTLPAQSSPVAKIVATYIRPLAVGSRGVDVKNLQTYLTMKGFLTMPKGVAPGYFGALTRDALKKYQMSVGLDSVGVLGPKTRALLNSGE
jgi:protocatechuate 3,4-dioxygenase beta subunit